MRTPAEDADMQQALLEFDRTVARLLTLNVSGAHLRQRVQNAESDLGQRVADLAATTDYALAESGAGFSPGDRVTVNGTAASVVGFRVLDHKVGVQVDGDGDGPVWLDPAALVDSHEATAMPSNHGENDE